MVVLIIFSVILQTDINVIMLSIGGQGANSLYCSPHLINVNALPCKTQMLQIVAKCLVVVTVKSSNDIIKHTIN